MASFLRAIRYLKDFWKVVIRGDNDDLARQTIAIQEELHRVRENRNPPPPPSMFACSLLYGTVFHEVFAN
jgi:hypothetical protein